MAAAGTVEPKGASVPASTVNLAKNIVGAGVLALASGVSSFSSSRAALPPALAIMLLLCSMSGYTFSTIARVGNAVGADSYRDTWAKVFGESTAIIPAFTVTFKTLCGALAYSIIVGDSFASIGKLVGGPALLASSNFMIVLLSIFVFLPLCLMRNLSSLAIGSVIGTAGTLCALCARQAHVRHGTARPHACCTCHTCCTCHAMPHLLHLPCHAMPCHVIPSHPIPSHAFSPSPLTRHGLHRPLHESARAGRLLRSGGQVPHSDRQEPPAEVRHRSGARDEPQRLRPRVDARHGTPRPLQPSATYWAYLLGALGSLCQLCLPCCPCSTTMLYHHALPPCCPCSTTMLYHTYTYQAFLAHYNAPKFFKELAGPKDGGSKLPRFNQVLTYTRVLLSIAHAGILEY